MSTAISTRTGPHLDVDEIDNALSRVPPDVDQTHLDLSEVTWIDIDALLYLLAILADPTARITLPRNPRQRDFLRRWGFPAAYEEMTSSAFSSALADLTDAEVLQADEERNPYPYFKDLVNIADRTEPLLSRRFFSIQQIRPAAVVEGSNATREDLVRERAIHARDRWKSTHIEAILGEHAQRIRIDVIFELILNALWHPNASRILTVSEHKSAENVFRIAIWDDGNGIANTLRRAFNRGVSLQPKLRPEAGRSYLVDHNPVWRDGQLLYERRISSGDLSSFEMSSPPGDDELLIASLFPGVTSRDDAQHRGGEAGMGLFHATDTAVAEHGGSILMRSGWHRCEITRPPERADRALAVKVDRVARTLPGNLFRVDIPLS